MPAVVVVCSACQTKLKVPENTAAKALRCPKCKGVVPLNLTKANPDDPSAAKPVSRAIQPAPAPPAAPPPKVEEFEVNEPAAEEEEFEVNDAAEEDEELEVNEADDKDEDTDDEEEEDDEAPLLAELGFPKGKDPFKIAKLPADARKAIVKTFIKNERALWAGKPSVKIIESKAWIGLIVGPIAVLAGISICVIVPVVLAVIPIDAMFMKILFAVLGAVVGLVFGGIGVLVLVFRKNIGGNKAACYVLSNKRAYIYDGARAVRAFTPQQIAKMRCEESAQFEDAGNLIFAHEMNEAEGVMLDKETSQKYTGTAVGFLNIDDVHTVRKMMHEVLIDPALKKAKQKKKAKRKKRKYFS